MKKRTRKLLGTIFILAFVIVYALIAMALAQSRPLQESGKVVQALLYAVLGLAWIVPILPLIKWMEGGRE